ncbi:hypothetical protein BM536_032000 [Streptomyces phaeoluteigriseus]|uniref:Uncharacterized protein n=1 Tax=Streptomyces phaeoluteigriseus TaxID=114686 RepID=A0A1V6MK26_9ACTN|nr:hypothetical protein [Streptomyces phaeoluteigriseus]OQD52735.1 hypothetical protein BM536_032000 [Streptomyces phaeoluteigriseus]
MSDTLTELEERVRSGDETVTPEQIEQARTMGRFAELRQEAADRRAAEEAAAKQARERADRIAEARRLLDGHGLDDVAPLYVAARDALSALVAACDGRTEAVGEAARLLATTDGVTAVWDGSTRNAVVEFEPGDRHTALPPGPVVQVLVGRLAEARPDGMAIDYTHSVARKLTPFPRVSPLDEALARREG